MLGISSSQDSQGMLAHANVDSLTKLIEAGRNAPWDQRVVTWEDAYLKQVSRVGGGGATPMHAWPMGQN